MGLNNGFIASRVLYLRTYTVVPSVSSCPVSLALPARFEQNFQTSSRMIMNRNSKMAINETFVNTSVSMLDGNREIKLRATFS